VTQHSSLGLERWRRFTLPQQLLAIANEMNRASKLQGPEDGERLRGSYERVLALTDLTIQANEGRALRRELLRWRDVVGGIYVGPGADPRAHAQAFRVLLQFHPETWAQLPYVTGAALHPRASD
jgi:hypothetical protein